MAEECGMKMETTIRGLPGEKERGGVAVGDGAEAIAAEHRRAVLGGFATEADGLGAGPYAGQGIDFDGLRAIMNKVRERDDERRRMEKACWGLVEERRAWRAAHPLRYELVTRSAPVFVLNVQGGSLGDPESRVWRDLYDAVCTSERTPYQFVLDLRGLEDVCVAGMRAVYEQWGATASALPVRSVALVEPRDAAVRASLQEALDAAPFGPGAGIAVGRFERARDVSAFMEALKEKI
ncbi:unnamed protein product [Durusdinium trenchii]|uniref:Uncharacterized protein n=1 Tax=Durusdinium trenchii TaxID=1381693 RepID=A0ABP0L8P3_9DINO